MPTRAGISGIGAIVLWAACTAGQTGNADRVAGWRGDIALVAAEARRVHAGPDRPAHGRAFAQAVADLERDIPTLSDRAIVVRLQGLLALLKDGHSLLYPAPGGRDDFAMLPIDIYLFQDGLFVVNGTGQGAALVGSRIARIGSKSIDELMAAMAPYVSQDNTMAVKAFATMYLIMPTFLEAWGATDRDGGVTLTVERDTTTRQVSLRAGPARRTPRRLFPPVSARRPTPLYLENSGRAFWLRQLPERDALYVQFNEVADAPDAPLAAFARKVHDALAEGRARHLIMDVRHNNGGDNTLLEPLLRAVVDFGALPGHRVYVITGRTTFSAAQNFINRLERRLPTMIVAGEPSMSSPNFTGEDNPVHLPFSGLTASISNRYWQDSTPDDRRPWIAPALPVELTSSDWLENRDPVLDAVLADLDDPVATKPGR